jgi:diguanylate cyclase (GGDEF)-like protein
VVLLLFAVYDSVNHQGAELAWRLATDLVPAVLLLVILLLRIRGVVTARNAGACVLLGSLVLSASVLVTVVLGKQAPILVYLLVMTVVNGASSFTHVQLALAQTVPVLGTAGALLAVGGVVPDAAQGDWVTLLLVCLAASLAIHLGRERGFVAMAAVLVELEQQALEDPLTGLGTRRVLERTFPILRSAAEAEAQPLFAVFVDVDGLKPVNDALGHDQGDRVLLVVARALEDSVGPRDVVVRWGGDEFAVVGIGGAEEADAVADAVTSRVQALNPLFGEWAGTVSTGRCSVAPDADLAALVIEADSDMYRRRGDGRRVAPAPG